MNNKQRCAWIEECQQAVWGNCYWCQHSYCAAHLITVEVYEKNQRREQIVEDDVCLCCLAQQYKRLAQKLEQIHAALHLDQGLRHLQLQLRRRGLASDRFRSSPSNRLEPG